MTTNTKEQLSKGRKDDTSASSSSLQQSLQDNSINTSLIATQPSEQSLCDLDADDISKGAFEQGEERNHMLSATKDSIVCRLRSLRNQGLDRLSTQISPQPRTRSSVDSDLSATKDSIVCRLRCISDRYQRQKILTIMPDEDREKHWWLKSKYALTNTRPKE